MNQVQLERTRRKQHLCAHEGAGVAEQLDGDAGLLGSVGERSYQIAVRTAVMKEQIGVGRQAMPQVSAREGSPTSQMERDATLTRLQQGEDVGPDDAAIESRFHRGS